MMSFAETAKACARVVRQVLDGAELSSGDLARQWPPSAKEHAFLDELWNDLIEFGNPAATEMLRPLLEDLARILDGPPDTPEEAKRLFVEATVRWDSDRL